MGILWARLEAGRPGGGDVVRVAADDDGAVPRRPGGGAIVRVMADDDGAVPGHLGEGPIVSDMVLDVADDGAFKDPAER